MVSTQQITKAMKMVAAAKLRRSQERIIQMRPFAQKMKSILQNVSSAGNDGDAWYSKERAVNKVLLVVITSDRGLCGGFNSSVIKAAMQLTREKYSSQFDKKQVTVLPIGKKAFEFFGKRNVPMVADYWNIFQPLSFDRVSEAAQFMMDAFRKSEYDKRKPIEDHECVAQESGNRA